MSAALEQARKVVLASIPPAENYASAKPDLVAGLQKRDFKYATAISELLLGELQEAILPTKIVSLSFEEARELYDESIYRGSFNRGTFNPKSPVVEGVIGRVDRTISEFQRERGSPGLGSFIKLSFMSPKDVSLRVTNEKTRTIMLQKVDRLWSRSSLWDRMFVLSSSHPQSKKVFLDSLYASLEVRSGLEAIGNVCQSYRCFEELSDALIDENYFHTNIIIRPWVQLRPGFEFRIYVSNRRITAASQYESVYYEEVWEEREQLRKSIGEFVRGSVIPRIQHRLPSVVVDVVMASDGALYVCELNPFASSSSGCLFSWSEDKDQMLAGEEEWRFVSPEDSSNEKTDVPENWAAVINSHIQKKRIVAFIIPVVVLLLALGFFFFFSLS